MKEIELELLMSNNFSCYHVHIESRKRASYMHVSLLSEMIWLLLSFPFDVMFNANRRNYNILLSLGKLELG